jgi:hypothetical protein
MRTCFFHAGMPKTGSTSLQTALDGASDGRITFPSFGEPTHNMVLRTVFSKRPQDLPEFKDAGLDPYALAELVQHYRRCLTVALSRDDDIILSAEAVLLQLRHAELRHMMTYLRNRFDRIEFLVYLRPLASLVGSQFQQRVRYGLSAFRLPPPRYGKLLSRVFALSGDTPVTVCTYDPAVLRGGDITQDVLHRTGLNVAIEAPVAVNRSLSAEATAILYGFNKYRAATHDPALLREMRRDMAERMSDYGHRRFGFSEAILEGHLRAHAEELDWVRRTTGLDLGGVRSVVEGPVTCEQDLLDMAADAGDAFLPDPRPP